MTHSEADELITIRDMLRFAVSRFNAEGLTFGQGTSDAVEEAVFLIGDEGERLVKDEDELKVQPGMRFRSAPK